MQVSPDRPRYFQARFDAGNSDTKSLQYSSGGEEEYTKQENYMYRSLRNVEPSEGRRRIPAEKDPKYQTAPFTRTPGLTTIEYRTARTPSKSSAKKLDSVYGRDLEPVQERYSEQSLMQRATSSLRRDDSYRSGSQDEDPTTRQTNLRHGGGIKSRTLSYSGRLTNDETEPNRYANFDADVRTQNDRVDERREASQKYSVEKKREQVQRDRLLNDTNQENPTLKSLSDYTFHARTGAGNSFETEQSNTHNSLQLISRRTALFGGTERQSDSKLQRNLIGTNETLDSKDSANPQARTGYFKVLDFQGDSNRKYRTLGNSFGGINRVELSKHEEPFQIINSDDPQILRSYAKRLIEKLQSKEELLEQMRQFHNELWESYEIAQKEIAQLKAQQDDTGDSEVQKEIEALKNSFSEIGKQNVLLVKDQEEILKERDVLKAKEAGHLKAIEKMTEENENLRKELRERLKESDNRIEGLIQQIRKLEAVNRGLLAEKQEINFKMQSLEKRRGFEEDGEIAVLKKLEEDNSLAIKALAIENDSLQMKNAQLRAILAGYTKTGQPPKYLNQSVNTSKHERHSADIEVSMFDDNSRNISNEDYSRNKVRRFKERINELESEVINLKLQLKSRPSLREYKQNEVRVKRFESDLERQRSQSIDISKPKDTDYFKNLVIEARDQLKVNSFSEIIPRIRHLYTEIKILSKFSDAVSDMIVKCSPLGYFEKRPNLKQAWRFLKGIMQEFGSAKKQAAIGRSLEEAISEIEELLVVNDFGEIRPKLKKLIQENNRMELLILKFKALNEFENVPLQELDKQLEYELRQKSKAASIGQK